MHSAQILLRRLLWLGMASCAGFTWGCGEALPDRAPVRGRVTVGGEPLKLGVIMFTPEHGRPAVGMLETDGAYELTTFEEGDGAVLGRHRVTLMAVESIGPPGPTSFEEERALGMLAPVENKELVPNYYNDATTSPLTATVEDKTNEINFDLPAFETASGLKETKSFAPREGR